MIINIFSNAKFNRMKEGKELTIRHQILSLFDGMDTQEAYITIAALMAQLVEITARNNESARNIVDWICQKALTQINIK